MGNFVKTWKRTFDAFDSRVKLWCQILIVSVIGSVVLSLYFARNFNGLKYPDAMRYAAIAKNIVTGVGYIESELWPARLIYDAEPPFYVNRVRPIFPMTMAAAFKIFGVSENVAALSSGVFFIFSLVLIWILSENLFSIRIAWITVALFAFDPTILQYSISGITEMPFLFFLTLALFIMVSADTLLLFFITGITFGTASLVRSEALIYALVAVILFRIYYRTSYTEKIVALGLGLLTVLTPYWIWNWLAFGNPFFELNKLWILGRTAGFPEYTIMRSLEHVNILTAILSNPLDITRKFIRCLIENYYLLPFRLTNPYVYLLFIIGIFGILASRINVPNKAKYLLLLACALMVFQVLFTSATIPDQGLRYIVPFLGIILIFAGRGINYILELWETEKKMIKNITLGCFLVFLICPTLYYDFFRGKSNALSHRAEYVQLGNTVAKYTDRKGLVLSNSPNHLAWYADRQTMVIPNTLVEMRKIDRLVGVSGVVIVFPSSLSNLGSEWNSVIKFRHLSSAFELLEFQSDNLQALIFVQTDSPQIVPNS